MTFFEQKFVNSVPISELSITKYWKIMFANSAVGCLFIFATASKSKYPPGITFPMRLSKKKRMRRFDSASEIKFPEDIRYFRTTIIGMNWGWVLETISWLELNNSRMKLLFFSKGKDLIPSEGRIALLFKYVPWRSIKGELLLTFWKKGFTLLVTLSEFFFKMVSVISTSLISVCYIFDK